MTERADRPQDASRDLSKLMEQSVSTLQEVDRRLQMVRSDLATLMSRASMLQAQVGEQGTGARGGLGGFGGFGPAYGAYGGPAFGAFPPAMPSPMQGSMAQGGMGSGFGAMSPGFGSAPPGTAPPQAGPGTGRDPRSEQPVSRVPSVDLIDQGEEYLVQVELPGVKKEDLDLMVSDRTVTIQARTRPDPDQGVVLLSERPPVEYRRMLPLPAEVATTKSKASFKDGILTLTVPKKVPSEGPRKLDVAYS